MADDRQQRGTTPPDCPARPSVRRQGSGASDAERARQARPAAGASQAHQVRPAANAPQARTGAVRPVQTSGLGRGGQAGRAWPHAPDARERPAWEEGRPLAGRLLGGPRGVRACLGGARRHRVLLLAGPACLRFAGGRGLRRAGRHCGHVACGPDGGLGRAARHQSRRRGLDLRAGHQGELPHHALGRRRDVPDARLLRQRGRLVDGRLWRRVPFGREPARLHGHEQHRVRAQPVERLHVRRHSRHGRRVGVRRPSDRLCAHSARELPPDLVRVGQRLRRRSSGADLVRQCGRLRCVRAGQDRPQHRDARRGIPGRLPTFPRRSRSPRATTTTAKTSATCCSAPSTSTRPQDPRMRERWTPRPPTR